MKATFVIITVGDRTSDLNDLILSIRQYQKFDDIDINMLYQGSEEDFAKIENLNLYTKIIKTEEKLGCHTARLRLLKAIDYDVYIGLDDDMIMGEHTDYSIPIKTVIEKRVGFIITNWARTQSMLDAKVPRKRNEFIQQIVCYPAGGMVFNNKIANLIRKLPEQKTAFDDAWSVTAYINGYKNYRFMGSLCIHKACRTGGMQRFMKDNPPNLMMEKFINYRRAKKQNGSGFDILIPLDRDVNITAKKLHNQFLK